MKLKEVHPNAGSLSFILNFKVDRIVEGIYSILKSIKLLGLIYKPLTPIATPTAPSDKSVSNR